MGLSIHYQLRTSWRSPRRVRRLLSQLRDQALELPFARVGEIVETVGPNASVERSAEYSANNWLFLQTGDAAPDAARPNGSRRRLIAFDVARRGLRTGQLRLLSRSATCRSRNLRELP